MLLLGLVLLCLLLLIWVVWMGTNNSWCEDMVVYLVGWVGTGSGSGCGRGGDAGNAVVVAVPSGAPVGCFGRPRSVVFINAFAAPLLWLLFVGGDGVAMVLALACWLGLVDGSGCCLVLALLYSLMLDVLMLGGFRFGG